MQYVDGFSVVKAKLYYLDKSHKVMVYNIFYMLLGSFCCYFADNLCIYIRKGCLSIIFFFYNSFVWFCCQGNIGLAEGIGKCSLTLFKILRRMMIVPQIFVRIWWWNDLTLNFSLYKVLKLLIQCLYCNKLIPNFYFYYYWASFGSLWVSRNFFYFRNLLFIFLVYCYL